MGRIEGKVAIVTGGASGIGAATALLFGREGAKVVVSDIRDEDGENIAGSIRNAGGEAHFRHHDVTREEEWAAVVKETVDRYGRLDILFNNAGIAVSGRLKELALDAFRRQMAVNVEAVFLGAKHAIPAMRGGGGGSIIITSSVAGLRGSPNLGAYSASKGAVRLLAKSIAKECAADGDNVRCNSIHPGIIDTPIWKRFEGPNPRLEAMGDDIPRALGQGTPMGRAGLPEEVANAVLFLASDESSYVNGSELVIDGATTA